MARKARIFTMGLALLAAAASIPAREATVQLNTQAFPPKLDVTWVVTVEGAFIDMAARPEGLVFNTNLGDFSFERARLTPTGGKDRPSITPSERAPYLSGWKTREEGGKIRYESTLCQEVQKTGGQTEVVAIPLIIHVNQQQVEYRPVMAEARNLRVKGTPDTQTVDYLFDVAFSGAYCPNDITFFARWDATLSQSRKTNTGWEPKDFRQTLKAGSTLQIPDIRISLFGPTPEDRMGVHRVALVGVDAQGNLITVKCDVTLLPPWKPGDSAKKTEEAPKIP